MFLLELPSLSSRSDLPVILVKIADVHGRRERRQRHPRSVLALVAPDHDVDQVLGGDLRSTILSPAIEPVTSSIIEISRLVPSSALPPPTSLQLRQI